MQVCNIIKGSSRRVRDGYSVGAWKAIEKEWNPMKGEVPSPLEIEEGSNFGKMGTLTHLWKNLFVVLFCQRQRCISCGCEGTDWGSGGWSPQYYRVFHE